MRVAIEGHASSEPKQPVATSELLHRMGDEPETGKPERSPLPPTNEQGHPR